MNTNDTTQGELAAEAVVGSFPDNFKLAIDHSLKILAVSDRVWRFLTDQGTEWTTILAFWRQVAKGKAPILLASNPGLLWSSGYVARELELLKSLGYAPAPCGTKLVIRANQTQRASGGTPQRGFTARFTDFFRNLMPADALGARAKQLLTPQGSDTQIAGMVKDRMGFLFSEHAAEIVQNDAFPRIFGNSIVVVAADSIRLRIVKDRSEFRFDVANVNAPETWHALSVAMAAASGQAPADALDTYFSIPQVSELLRREFPTLHEAFAPQNYGSLLEAMNAIDAARRTAWWKSHPNAEDLQ